MSSHATKPLPPHCDCTCCPHDDSTTHHRYSSGRGGLAPSSGGGPSGGGGGGHEPFPQPEKDSDSSSDTISDDAEAAQLLASLPKPPRRSSGGQPTDLSAMTPVSRILSQRRSQVFGLEGGHLQVAASSTSATSAGPAPAEAPVRLCGHFCGKEGGDCAQRRWLFSSGRLAALLLLLLLLCGGGYRGCCG
jgi:hypothetical protein